MKHYLIGMLAGAAVVMAVGYAVITMRHRRVASSHPVTTLVQRLAQIQEEFDASLTKTANDTSVLPEVRVDALAAKAKADALFAVDARWGTRETEIYMQQEAEHWQRVKQVLPHAHPRATESWQIESKEKLDERLDEIVNDPRSDPANHADSVAGKQKFDALFALDRLLGTTESAIFLQQETDRSERILATMKALQKR